MMTTKRSEESRIPVAKIPSYNFFRLSSVGGMIFTFSLTVSDAMAAAHSGSSLATFLSSNPPSIRTLERLFVFVRESSRFELGNRSKVTGSFFDKIFISATSSIDYSVCPRFGCPVFSNHTFKRNGSGWSYISPR